jgi:hypothetical protein
MSQTFWYIAMSNEGSSALLPSDQTTRKLIFSLKDLLHITLNVPDFSSAVANVNESMVDALTGFTI